MRPRRVVYVIGGLGRGGAERQLLELCRSLDPDRYTAFVCATDSGYDFADAFSEAGVRFEELPRRGAWDFGRLFRLIRILRRERPELIHAFLPAPSRYARIASAFLKPRPRVVVSERGSRNARSRLQTWIDRQLHRFTDVYLGNASPVGELLRGILAGLDPEIEIIPNGIDSRRFAKTRPREEIRRELGWREEETILLGVGRLVWEKDWPTLVDAVAALPGTHHVRAAIAGQGPLQGELEATIRASGAPIELLGVRTDIPELMAAADLFVLSSKTEGFPNVIAEALLAGLPVVSTAAGGVPDVVRDGIDGRVVAVGDSEALGRAIAELLSDPDTARALAGSGRERILEHFPVRRMVERTTALYDRLLAGSSTQSTV